MKKYLHNMHKIHTGKNVNSLPSDLLEMSTDPWMGNYQMQVQHNHYRWFLDRDICSEHKYRDFIQCCISADDEDMIELLVSCQGGNLGTTISLVNAIRESSAFTRAVITSEAHSGASFVALSCDEVMAMPNSCMLIHNPRGVLGGNHQEIILRTKFDESYISDFYHEVYADFLTDQEIEDVLLGKDIWLKSDEINERVENRQKIRHERFVQEQKEQAEQNTEDPDHADNEDDESWMYGIEAATGIDTRSVDNH